ncbi:protein of unknown function [Streptococcus thermophilus]|nr:protein of unknown function [Streptococcus thermophilus]
MTTDGEREKDLNKKDCLKVELQYLTMNEFKTTQKLHRNYNQYYNPNHWYYRLYTIL